MHSATVKCIPTPHTCDACSQKARMVQCMYTCSQCLCSLRCKLVKLRILLFLSLNWLHVVHAIVWTTNLSSLCKGAVRSCAAWNWLIDKYSSKGADGWRGRDVCMSPVWISNWFNWHKSSYFSSLHCPPYCCSFYTVFPVIIYICRVS